MKEGPAWRNVNLPRAAGRKCSRLELLQEAHVALKEQADILDAVLEKGDALDAHAEGEAPDLLGIVVHHPEDVGVDHAAPQDLEPPFPAAEAAALAPADAALDVHFGAGLGEREITGPEPDAPVLAEERVSHRRQGALEVGHGHALVDQEPLDLVKHGRVRDRQSVV